jgi:DNA repair exonuclease SbcCD ATPase subunit
MRSDLASAAVRASLALILPALLLATTAPLSTRPAAAQSERSATAEQSTADDEFSRQLSELGKTFTELSRKIEDSASSIGRLDSAEAARSEIEQLRAHVGALLGAVADNGTVWNLGARALKRAEEKLKSLEQETRFKPEDRQYLIERWRELKAATESAIGKLEGARKDFANLLRTLQTNEDFISELLEVREHAKALEVIHKLTDGIRDASDKLKKLLTTLKTPGV